MSYTPTQWIDRETPVNAENLNKLEQAVYANDTAIDEINTARENGEFFTEADKAELVNAVIAALPKYAGEVVEV